MYFKKKGLPDEGDLVLCTVKKISYHSIFVDLDEYEKQDAMIHISEVAPGRIRNIRDYVTEGRKLICKVLRVKHERKQVDLSLRRVSVGARKSKNEDIKQQLKAEKMLESLVVKLKLNKDKVFKEIGLPILEHYDNLFQAFQDVVLEGEDVLKECNVPSKYIKPLVEIIKERIKPPEVLVEGVFELTSRSSKGINDIKEALKECDKVASQEGVKASLIYLGAPNYKVIVKASDYKVAENALKKIVEAVLDKLNSLGGKGSFKKK
ncbi:translation initiation factor IF-2 subunit alpha [Candidatus Woesearchaeota archaeon]|nr:MAG: translation initiation factor IF-2 subunit alpha [Candidatus Woesearchaeota archaeon]